MKYISDIKFNIALVLSFSVTGMMFPYGMPIYSPLVGILFLYTLFKEKQIIFFDKNLIILYLLELLYFVSLIHSNTFVLYTHVKKDIINIITIDLIIIVLINNLKTKSDFLQFYDYLKKIIFITATFIAFIAFYKYILLLNGYNYIDFFISNGQYPWGTSLVTDYNSFSFGLIVAILFSYKLFQKNSNFIFKIIIVNLSTLLISVALLSGSRRALIVVFCVATIFIIIKYYRNTNFFKNNIYFIISGLLTFTIVLFLINADLSAHHSGHTTSAYTTSGHNSYEVKKLINRAKTIDKYSSIDARIIRWQYALELYDNYSIEEKLLGKGFEYLKLFNTKFDNVKGEDYPHNSIITQALYSGLVGVFLLIIFYYYIFKYYLKYLSDLKRLFIIFLIATFFELISGNTFFSLKLYLLLVILPFIYHYINTKEKIENSNINSTK